MKLEDVSIEDLKKEINRRKKCEDVLIEPLEEMDFTDLISECKAVTEHIYKDKYDDEDNKHYIYEAAIKAVFGDKYWVWKTKQCKR
jgi:hypothetical protein